MGLVSGRVLIVLLVIFVGFGWSVANGLVTWGTNDYECYGGKHFVAVGSPVPWLWAGKLKLKYQPYQWGCDSDHQYSPKQYHVVDGLLVPVGQNSPSL